MVPRTLRQSHNAQSIQYPSLASKYYIDYSDFGSLNLKNFIERLSASNKNIAVKDTRAYWLLLSCPTAGPVTNELLRPRPGRNQAEARAEALIMLRYSFAEQHSAKEVVQVISSSDNFSIV